MCSKARRVPASSQVFVQKSSAALLPAPVTSLAAVVELCAALDSTLGISVAQHCIKSLGGDAAVPAAVVLHSLLTQLWRKQVLAVGCFSFRAGPGEGESRHSLLRQLLRKQASCAQDAPYNLRQASLPPAAHPPSP